MFNLTNSTGFLANAIGAEDVTEFASGDNVFQSTFVTTFNNEEGPNSYSPEIVMYPDNTNNNYNFEFNYDYGTTVVIDLNLYKIALAFIASCVLIFVIISALYLGYMNFSYNVQKIKDTAVRAFNCVGGCFKRSEGPAQISETSTTPQWDGVSTIEVV